LTTFVELSARLKNFFGGWLLVLGIKEGLAECATVFVKSVVILRYWLFFFLTKYGNLPTLKIKIALWLFLWIYSLFVFFSLSTYLMSFSVFGNNSGKHVETP
jgi:hypothetical protein